MSSKSNFLKIFLLSLLFLQPQCLEYVVSVPGYVKSHCTGSDQGCIRMSI